MRYAESILEMIYKSDAHMTAEQVFLALKQQYPSVVLATVYNNLNSLYQQGKIRKISLEGYPDRYDKLIRHDHLFCRWCGKLSDIYLSDITGELERQIGFFFFLYDLKIQCFCPQCRAEQRDPNSVYESE